MKNLNNEENLFKIRKEFHESLKMIQVQTREKNMLRLQQDKVEFAAIRFMRNYEVIAEVIEE